MADDLYATPEMTGVPAAVCECGPGKALSTFDPGFHGIMVGAQHVPGAGPCLFVGVLQGDGRFVAGATTRQHWITLRRRLDETIAALESGAFDVPERAS